MCTVSNIGDYWKNRMPIVHPWVQPYVYPSEEPIKKWPPINPLPYPTREEFQALKEEIEELKKLLLAAKTFDEKTNQPDCELDDKVDLIKKVAKLVGVDISDVFK